ncbi:MAG: ABC transporter substrate-binding protein, partial [Lautropia sp.]|nr:ABC transporter substrate-binding protein [Lautropia sp.]
ADPLNQRAIFEEAGFFQVQFGQLWNGHPCCSFAIAEQFITRYPGSFAAMLRAALKGSAYSRGTTNRREIARKIAGPNYLNQPEIVVRQALTGRFADGLGNVVEIPDRVEFNPIPWHSMAIWMLTQLQRWGYVKGHVDYRQLAEQVFLLTDARKAMQQLGQAFPEQPYSRFDVMGKPFDAGRPEAYLNAFPVRRGA